MSAIFHRNRMKAAWIELVNSQQPQWAVSLAYNPHRSGLSSSPAFRISSDGECERIAGTGMDGNAIYDNFHVSNSKIHREVSWLHQRVDRKLFGSHYHLLSRNKRSSFLGFVEHEKTNTHLHLAWTVPKDRELDPCILIEDTWKSIHPRYTAVAKPVVDGNWSKYTLKSQICSIIGDRPELFISSYALI